jgi:hypothetical protein
MPAWSPWPAPAAPTWATGPCRPACAERGLEGPGRRLSLFARLLGRPGHAERGVPWSLCSPRLARGPLITAPAQALGGRPTPAPLAGKPGRPGPGHHRGAPPPRRGEFVAFALGDASALRAKFSRVFICDHAVRSRPSFSGTCRKFQVVSYMYPVITNARGLSSPKKIAPKIFRKNRPFT